MKKVAAKTLEEFAGCRNFSEMFETETCGRCGGTGNYSFNMMDGTRCYGCGGSGKKFTRKSKKALATFKQLQEVDVTTVQAGDRVFDGKKFFTVLNAQPESDGVKLELKATWNGEPCEYIYRVSGKVRKAHAIEESYEFYLKAIGAK